MKDVKTWVTLCYQLLMLGIGLAACGGAQVPADLQPSGAANGRNTFVFLYTDN